MTVVRLRASEDLHRLVDSVVRRRLGAGAVEGLVEGDDDAFGVSGSDGGDGGEGGVGRRDHDRGASGVGLAAGVGYGEADGVGSRLVVGVGGGDGGGAGTIAEIPLVAGDFAGGSE